MSCCQITLNSTSVPKEVTVNCGDIMIKKTFNPRERVST